MIPQVGLPEILIIGALALIVVGPKDLPLMMRKVGRMVAQAKRLAREFQASFDELGRQAELDELKKEVESLKKTATGDIDEELRRTSRDMDKAMRDTPAKKPAAAPGDENRIAPGTDTESPKAADAAAAAKPRPSGPRIEPVAKPKPAPAAEPASEDSGGAAPAPDPEPASAKD